jgi:Excalibur calcium-binding domain
MKALPNGWHIFQGKPDRDPEKELAKLKRGFAAISRRLNRAIAFRRLRRTTRRLAVDALLIALALVALCSLIEILSPWSVTMTLRHLAAAYNCDTARLVGLAPARRGQPGYWSGNDADSDGWACEPWH